MVYLKSILVCLFFLALFFSCSNENAYEVLNMDEFLPEKESTVVEEIVSETDDEKDTVLVAFLNQFDVFDEIEYCENNLFPDRFQFEHKTKVCLSHKELDLDLEIYQWQFMDSVQNINVFYNWMDCFSEKCFELIPGESTQMRLDYFFCLLVDINEIQFYKSKNKNVIESVLKDIISRDTEEQFVWILSKTNKSVIKWHQSSE